MTELTLQNLSVPQVAALGDAALKEGHIGLARGFYRALLKAAPRIPQVLTRHGLTLRPHGRTKVMLEVLNALEQIPNAAIFVGEGLATWLKNPPFARDETFLRLVDAHQDIAPAGVTNWHWNLQTVLWAAQQARGLPGDFVELGVYKGHTTLFLAEYLGFADWNKRWWLYDTFEGVPPDQLDPGRETLTAAAYGRAFSFEEVRDRFAPFGNITVLKGRVPEAFQDSAPEAISFMHIDLNSAVAEIGALDALYDRLTPGGVIVFDDFCWSSAHVQYKAEVEWFASRGLTVLALPTGQGVFVKPPAA
ncbi:MAG: TylF/MycF/NovP-related O-methyltransferase [Caulobacteraceae bacterium]